MQRIGREEGREEGKKGFQRLLSKLFSRKFQLEPESLIGLFEDLSMEQMEKLGARIFEASNIEDVKIWISALLPPELLSQKTRSSLTEKPKT